MGKRGETARDVILKRAKEQMDEALIERDVKRAASDNAQVRYEAKVEIYEQLVIALAPKPRSNGSAPKPKRASKAAASAMTTVVLKATPCATCGEPDNHWSHDSSYGASHPFVSLSVAPSAKRKSSPASASPKAGDPSTLVMSDSVISASNVEGSEK